MDKILGYVVSGIAGGIGLASESITARKQAKTSRSNADNNDSNKDVPSPVQEPEEETAVEEGDDELLDLDEAQDELTRTVSPKNHPKQDATQITEAFIRQFPLPEYTEHAPLSQLQFPVILPQRRPKDRSRGFIRAYAPELEKCGIDQAMFLEFLETFQKSSEASPWLQAINLASIGTMFLPTVTGFLVGIAIQASVQIAMGVQSRSRTNTFLDKINDDFFRPRGLYCLVMTWNPESDDMHGSADLTSTITTSLNPKGGLGKVKNNLRSSSGKTYGNVDFPEAAPLIFPALDKLAGQTGEEAVRKRNKLKKKANFVDEYFDKRAQAKYAGKHPDSALVQGPKPTFTSRYADPNHPASNGNLISLVTGGLLNPPSLGGGGSRGGLGGARSGFGGGGGGGLGALLGSGRGGYGGGMGRGNRMGRAGMDQYGFTQDSYGRGIGNAGAGAVPGRGVGLGGLPSLGGPQMVKRVLKKNVVYLMIVNMPSGEEMAAAMAMIEQNRR